jgi:hypothetical protein
MAYTQPTPEIFKIRYPEFAPVSDALVGLIIDEAISQVGETWLEKDRARAQMLLAAHTLTMEGEPGRTTTGASTAGTGQIKRDKVGDTETEFAGSSASVNGDPANYSATEYGRQFLLLMRKNFTGPVAV